MKRPYADRSVIAIDVGGTLIKGAVVGRHGEVLCRSRQPTRADGSPQAVLASIVEVIRELSAWTDNNLDAYTAAVGIVVPGDVDEQAGIAHESANLGWSNVALREIVSSETGLPTAVGHDVRAGAIAEGLLGAARGNANYLFLPIGTGIAGAFVIDGRLHAGAYYQSSEIGHITVDPNGEPCGCGRRGCLETIASARAIGRRYASRRSESVPVDAAEVVRRALAGDAEAEEIWRQAIAALAETLANITLIVGPELIVIGGGLSGASTALVDPLSCELATRLSHRVQPRIVCSTLGDEAGCLGAAILAWRAAGVDPAALGWGE